MTARKSAIFLFSVTVLCAARRVHGAAGDGVNMAELHVLCQLAKLAEADVSALVVPALSTDSVDDIEMLNMSESEQQWQQNFEEEGASKAQPDSPCKPPDSRLICNEKYSKWKQVKTALRTAEKAQTTKFEHELPTGIQATAAGRRCQKQLHELAAAAADAVNDYESTYGATIQNIRAKLEHELKQALNGEQSPPSAGQAYTATITTDGGRTSDCADTSAGESLKKDLLCLCVPDDTQTKKTCGDGGTPAPGDNLAASATDTNAKQLLTKCDNYAKPVLSANSIDRALAGFRHALQSHKQGSRDAIVLGKPAAAWTCGAAASEACIDYTAVVQPKASGEDNDIKWYKHMVAAQALLKTLDAAKVAASATKNA
uniref:Variant surface glycoprotein 1125.1394 n=1 Tax=Trypanosoma brucei TaxID=5691 RepID=A0A1J0R6X2_9TRYP|nr:variant surface glycoprotein 1125.1394 [Trypanosoma brucei]